MRVTQLFHHLFFLGLRNRNHNPLLPNALRGFVYTQGELRLLSISFAIGHVSGNMSPYAVVSSGTGFHRDCHLFDSET
jgi:hypothetical protein